MPAKTQPQKKKGGLTLYLESKKSAPKPPPRRRRPRRNRKVRTRNPRGPLPLTTRARNMLTSRGTDEVMRSITLPRETRALRFPQAGDVQKTAVFRLYDEGYLEHPTTGSFATSFFLCPSPIHPLWLLRNHVGGTLQSVLSSSTWAPLSNSAYSTQTDLDEIQLTSYSGTADAPLPGLPRTYGSNKFRGCSIYTPANSTVTFAFATAGAAGNVIISYRLWTNADDNTGYNISIPVTLNTGGTASLTLPRGGWLDIVSWKAATATFTATMVLIITVTLAANQRYLLPSRPYPLSSTELLAVRTSCRVTANSLLLTNTSAEAQQGGTLFGARINALAPNTNNVWDVSSIPTFISATNRVNKWRGEGKLGLYTYTVPSVSSHKFDNYTEVEGTSPSSTSYFFCLADMDFVNVGYYVGSTTTITNTGTSSQQFTWQYDEHLEGISDSPVYTLGVPSMSLDTYQKALTAASARTPFTENPRHLALLGQAARALVRPHIPFLRGKMANLYLNADSALSSL